MRQYYPVPSRRNGPDSALALAIFFWQKRGVVANKDLEAVLYLPSIESFDVARWYFASIEKHDVLLSERSGGEELAIAE
jgi:hypothetical protein